MKKKWRWPCTWDFMHMGKGRKQIEGGFNGDGFDGRVLWICRVAAMHMGLPIRGKVGDKRVGNE